MFEREVNPKNSKIVGKKRFEGLSKERPQIKDNRSSKNSLLLFDNLSVVQDSKWKKVGLVKTPLKSMVKQGRLAGNLP